MTKYLTKIQFIGGQETVWKLNDDKSIIWDYSTGWQLYGITLARPGIKTIATTPSPGFAGTGYSNNDILTVTEGYLGTVKVLDVDEVTGAVLTLQAESFNNGGGYTMGANKATTGGTGTGCKIEITVLDEGNIYVTGDRANSKTLWRIDNNGNFMNSADVGKLCWDVAVSEIDGSTYVVTGSPITVGEVYKFDKAFGAPAWNVTVCALSLYGVAVDSNGNVFVVGSRKGNDPLKTVWKLDSDGNIVASYDTKAMTVGITIDSSDNVYVTGWSETQTTDEPFVWKLTNALEFIWSGKVTNELCAGFCVKVDGSGNIFVGGAQGDRMAQQKIFKFNSSGVFQSSFTPLIYNYITDIALGGDAIYVTGVHANMLDHSLFKWSLGYIKQWGRCLGHNFNDGIEVDGDNKIYVCGGPQQEHH